MVDVFHARAISNKHTYICDRITVGKLAFCAVVEMWHDMSDCMNCYLHGIAVNTPVIVVYRPCPLRSRMRSLTTYNRILDRAATFASSLVIIGDVNIHLDAATDPNTIKFDQALDSHGLVQHVVELRHNRGHTLDVLITRKDVTVTVSYGNVR